MNYLEKSLKEFLTDNDISEMTVKDIAEQLYVSRALVYKVLNKMGYTSFGQFKIEKQNYHHHQQYGVSNANEDNKRIEEKLVVDIKKANIVYVVGFQENKIAAEYMTTQFLNIKKISQAIVHMNQLKSQLAMLRESDLIIFLSNTGTEDDFAPEINGILSGKYAITQEGSNLSGMVENTILINSYSEIFSNKYERENLIQMLIAIQHIFDLYNGDK